MTKIKAIRDDNTSLQHYKKGEIFILEKTNVKGYKHIIEMSCLKTFVRLEGDMRDFIFIK